VAALLFSSVAAVDDILRIVGACTAELEATAVAKGWEGLTSLDFERAMWNASGARSATLQLKSGVASVDVLLPDRTAIVLRWGPTLGDIASLGFALAEGTVKRAYVVCAATLSDWSSSSTIWPPEGVVAATDAGAIPVMLDGEPFRIRVARLGVEDAELLEELGPLRIVRAPVELFAYDDEDEFVRVFFSAYTERVAEIEVGESPAVVTVTVYRRVICGVTADGYMQAETAEGRVGCVELGLALRGRRLIDGSDAAALRERDRHAPVAEFDWHLARALTRGCPRWVP
jgi:hypothetical protein